MSEHRTHRTWCPAYPGNVYVKTVDQGAWALADRVKVIKGPNRPCQCGADLSERARRLIAGEAS